METHNNPVTVGVITYNSSKYVLETLESIKAQSYQPLKLIIGDDCSSDNTVELCRKWIEKNKSRFLSTRIIVPEHNTGVSGNCNRVENACDTEWYKGIAGDDILMPNCICDYMEYAKKNPDMVLVFGRMKSFGASKKICEHYDQSVFFQDFFSWDAKTQYDYLLNVRNCLPAPTAFWNIYRKRLLNLSYDERIPLQEDYAQWINFLRKGEKIKVIDAFTVTYRISETSLSTSALQSIRYFESCRLFDFFYKFQNIYAENPDLAIRNAVLFEIELYSKYLNSQKEYTILRNSRSYKLGSLLLSPLVWTYNNMKYLINKIR